MSEFEIGLKIQYSIFGLILRLEKGISHQKSVKCVMDKLEKLPLLTQENWASF